MIRPVEGRKYLFRGSRNLSPRVSILEPQSIILQFAVENTATHCLRTRLSMKGRLTIVLIFAVALAMGAYGWWHNFRQGQQSLQFWGSDAAVLIRFAPDVQLLLLDPVPDSNRRLETLDIGQRRLAVIQRVEISQVPGLVHARHALIEDASFDWSTTRLPDQPNWQFALRFLRKKQQVTVAFDTNCNRVALVGQTPNAKLLAERMEAFDRRRNDWIQSR